MINFESVVQRRDRSFFRSSTGDSLLDRPRSAVQHDICEYTLPRSASYDCDCISEQSSSLFDENGGLPLTTLPRLSQGQPKLGAGTLPPRNFPNSCNGPVFDSNQLRGWCASRRSSMLVRHPADGKGEMHSVWANGVSSDSTEASSESSGTSGRQTIAEISSMEYGLLQASTVGDISTNSISSSKSGRWLSKSKRRAPARPSESTAECQLQEENVIDGVTELNSKVARLSPRFCATVISIDPEQSSGSPMISPILSSMPSGTRCFPSNPRNNSTALSLWRKVSISVRFFTRMQVFAERESGMNHAKATGMVRDIADMLASEYAYRQACVEAFVEYSVPQCTKYGHVSTGRFSAEEGMRRTPTESTRVPQSTKNGHVPTSRYSAEEGMRRTPTESTRRTPTENPPKEYMVKRTGTAHLSKTARTTQLPVKCLSKVLVRWNIPADFVYLFWVHVWRKTSATEGKTDPLPEFMQYEAFESVVAPVLRRVRHMHTANLEVTRAQTIVQNRRKLEDEYLEGALIGEGSFGRCIYIKHKVTKNMAVCKSLKKKTEVDVSEMHNELEVMKQLDHPNILRVFEWFESDTALELVVEVAKGGDLRKVHLEVLDLGKKGLPEDLTAVVAQQTLEALQYIHVKNVIHRDVKPSNILLAQPVNPLAATQQELRFVRALLADFGVADFTSTNKRRISMLDHFVRQKCKTGGFKGTVAYMALEVFEQEPENRSDVWSLGVMVQELLCNKRPVKGEGPMGFYAQLRKVEPDLTPLTEARVSESGKNFVASLLVKDVRQRPTAIEAGRHQWLQNIFHDGDAYLSSKKGKIRRRLRTFQSLGHLSKTVKYCIAAHMNTSDVEEWTRIFKSLDRDRDGVLSIEELTSGMKDVGLDRQTVEMLIDSADIFKEGKIGYTEFIAALMDTIEDDVLMQAFKLFDLDGSGFITLQELAKALAGGAASAILPDGLTAKDILDEIDLTGDGTISPEEWCSFFKKNWQRQDDGQQAEEDVVQPQDSGEMYTLISSTGSGVTRVLSSNSKEENETGGTNCTQSKNCASSEDVVLGNVLADIGEMLQAQSCKMTSSRYLMMGRRPCASRDGPTTRPDYKELCKNVGKRLLEDHWLLTLSDLGLLGTEEWTALQLPAKLQSLLKARLLRENRS